MTRTRAAACALALAAHGACSRVEPPSARAQTARTTASAAAPPLDSAPARGPRLPAEERTWVFEETPVGRMVVVVLLPERGPDERFPVLVPFHGRGEALKGPDRGARGWVDDYGMLAALERLRHPPLTKDDFLSFVTSSRLARINAALAERAYRGLVIACPYTPDRLAGEAFMEKAAPLARFVVEQLLPRLYRETPALGTPASTGIDGVSLGGRAAYTIALTRPEAFGAAGGLQAAFDVKDAPVLLAHARTARQKNAGLSFRMLTSDEDYFREADAAIARAFSGAGIPMRFDVVVGPHDYAFNRGPGVYEMLLFHDRALRGEPPP